MTERRTLVEGLKSTPLIDPKVEKDFVFQSKGQTVGGTTVTNIPTPISSSISTVSYAPLSTRIRADLATALKRASLERQLAGIEPKTVKDILEQILEPWLKTNGYLD